MPANSKVYFNIYDRDLFSAEKIGEASLAVSTNGQRYTFIRTYVCIYAYVCTSLSLSLSLSLCVCVCVCVCLHFLTLAGAHARARTFAQARMPTQHMYTHIYTCESRSHRPSPGERWLPLRRGGEDAGAGDLLVHLSALFPPAPPPDPEVRAPAVRLHPISKATHPNHPCPLLRHRLRSPCRRRCRRHRLARSGGQVATATGMI